MSDRAEWWAHFGGSVVLGALVAVLPVVVVVFLAGTWTGYVRETEQERAARKRHAEIEYLYRPGDPRGWSEHRRDEWYAWVYGSALIAGVYQGVSWLVA